MTNPLSDDCFLRFKQPSLKCIKIRNGAAAFCATSPKQNLPGVGYKRQPAAIPIYGIILFIIAVVLIICVIELVIITCRAVVLTGIGIKTRSVRAL